MGKFKHMPDEIWPDESLHVEYAEVYRAAKNADELKVDDFLPWNIEHPNQMKTFKKLFHQPSYGLSVFTDLESLKKTVESVPPLNESTKAFAKGFTTIARGISLIENARHHVEYFLYDYEYNSPKDDFCIVEVRKGT